MKADHTLKNIFVKNAIAPSFIAECIGQHSKKTSIGAHDIFLGQVRADIIDGKTVEGIEYTAYEDMAFQQMHRIREETFEKYALTCMHVYHSLGNVNTGALCLFVFTSSPHRRDAMDACREVVERIKSELPIWGKERFADDTYQWKTNR